MNKDFLGRRIRPENYPGSRQKPDSELYFKNISPWTRDLAAGLNKATGGDSVTPGFIDVSPETLEHFAGFATGGMGKFVSNVAATGRALAEGETPELRTTPFARRFFYERRPGVDTDKVRAQYETLFDNEKLRHTMAEADYAPAPPERKIPLRGKLVELNEEEYRAFVDADKKMSDRLSSDVESPRFQRMTAEQQKKFLQGRYRLASDDARRKILPAIARRVAMEG